MESRIPGVKRVSQDNSTTNDVTFTTSHTQIQLPRDCVLFIDPSQPNVFTKVCYRQKDSRGKIDMNCAKSQEYLYKVTYSIVNLNSKSD